MNIITWKEMTLGQKIRKIRAQISLHLEYFILGKRQGYTNYHDWARDN